MIVTAIVSAALQAAPTKPNIVEGQFEAPHLAMSYPEYIAPMVRAYRDCISPSHPVPVEGQDYEGATHKLIESCAPLRATALTDALAARKKQGREVAETEANVSGVFDQLDLNAVLLAKSSDQLMAVGPVPQAPN